VSVLKDRYDLAYALRRYHEAITELSDEDLLKLADESYTIEIKFSRRRSKPNIDIELNYDSLENLSKKILSTDNRNDALNTLNTFLKTKKSLEALARHLEIPVLKSDKSDNLAEKIVEATVGARKRSEAIQGYSKQTATPNEQKTD
jgi:hypothetical protein